MKTYVPEDGPLAPARGTSTEVGSGAGSIPPRIGLARLLLEGRGWTATRLGLDVLLLVLAVGAAFAAPPDEIGPDGQWVVWLLPPLVLGLFALRRMYSGELQVQVLEGLGTIVASTSLAAAGLIATAAFTHPSDDPASLVARAWLFATLYLTGGRVLLAWGQRRARVNKLIGKPTLIVGAGRIGAQVERRLREQPEWGLRPLGYLDDDPAPAEMVPGRQAPVLGAFNDLGRIVDESGARHVVLGFTSGPDTLLLPIVRECEVRGLEISLVPRLFESINVRIGLQHIGGLPLFGLRAVNPKGWQFAVKHGVGRVLAAIGLILLSPLLLAIAIAVRLSSPGPVIFAQRRIGRDGRDFHLYKFRSMRGQEAIPQDLLEDGLVSGTDTAPGGVEGDDRRTRVGSMIRAVSFDELPQLFNVLRGDMTLVGPRPERPEFVEMFGRSVYRYEDRHRVKSGITGWAQVNGLRGQTSLSDRIEWDNYYIENWSLGLDLKILLMTFVVLFNRAE